jgi:hypothetical protein
MTNLLQRRNAKISSLVLVTCQINNLVAIGGMVYVVEDVQKAVVLQSCSERTG